MAAPVSEQLREATRSQHEGLEALPFSIELRTGTVSRASYIAWLRCLRTLFRAVETAAAAVPALQALAPERASLLLDDDLATLDASPHRVLRSAEARAAAAAQELGLAAEDDAFRIAGYQYVLLGSQLGGLVLRRPVGAALQLEDRGLRFLRRGEDGGAARMAAFRAAVDAAVVTDAQVASALSGAAAAFSAFGAVMRALSSPEGDAPHLTATTLNPDGGTYSIADDPREIDAALRAGLRTLREYPYYVARYGQRGRQFTRSDSAWLASLTRNHETIARGQVQWLAGVLAARGMPSYLLEQHLLVLEEELAAAAPERAPQYRRLGDLARDLARGRRGVLEDTQLHELERSFDEAVGAELAAALPRSGFLVGAAVADEGNGRAGAVSSLTSWLGDDGRFPAPWVRAVLETVSRARRLASKRGPRAAAPAGDSVPARGSVPPSRK